MDKPKFNLIDGLIVLALIAIIAVGIVFLNRSTPAGNGASSENSTAVYQVEFTQSDISLYDNILSAKNSGNAVWVGEKERFECKIKDVVANPAKKIITDYRTGEAVFGEYPGLYDIVVTLESEVTETPYHISASGTAITVGAEVSVKSKTFAGYGFIIDLKTIH